MKFIVDAHFPKRLATWLINNGDDAIHTIDLPKKNKTSDKEIIEIAESQARIVITKDSDFIQFRIIHDKPQRILMVTTGNIINKALIKLFEANFQLFDNYLKMGKKLLKLIMKTLLFMNKWRIFQYDN